MPLNPSDYTKDFEYAHLRLERYGWLLRKFELVAEDQMEPDIFELLALPRAGTYTDEEIADAHRVASKKRMRAEKADGEAAREVGKAIDRARDILKSPEATAAYREWRAAKIATHAATVPIPPQNTSATASTGGQTLPTPSPVIPPQPVRRNPLAPVLASVAVIALGAVTFLALRPHTPGAAEAATGPTATPAATVAPTVAPVATSSATPSVSPAKIASQKETSAANDINNTIAAELVTAQQKQRQGKLSTADAAALRTHLRQQAAESLRHADAALKLDPSNDAAAYEAVNALYYSDDFTGAYRRVQEAVTRFPNNSDLKTIKTMIEAHLH